MRKTYIIRNARKILEEQIKNRRKVEKFVMSEKPIRNTKGLTAVIPKNNSGRI